MCCSLEKGIKEYGSNLGISEVPTQMSSQQVSYLGSSSNYVTLLLSGTLIKHGVNEVLTDKKEGTKVKNY
jgi:hypothetical protein